MKFATFLGVLLCSTALVLSDDDEKFNCTKGVYYVENKCNGCYCQDDGKLRCTLMGCATHFDQKLRNCPFGYMWTEGCERCWCVKNIGTLCTTECGRRSE
ncbi:hypothetical protein ILUMI_08607 [Ignelater luminosus]|uniref:Pacifastin domain-containing protein n=1 Tax=Ignelater luminosus TaxID=2038154 RepID=A0A8K0D5U5_IGNLU|nr:hypothetical protein ILUMI_08607 [Ignelater luminosus]